MDPIELSAGVRTVRHVAQYFGELKDSAARLTQRITAQQRGYFTPDEEDDVLALHVSYWQTRNALFDLIWTMRREGDDLADAPPAHFLVAFAAAALLVDAARFLRETVEQRPIVRDKLNEAAPTFGIPAGVYDTIQKSLLSARNGWHLFHARKYFQEQHDQLHRVAADLHASWLIDLIEALDSRLDVTVSQFTRAKLRTRTNQMARLAAAHLVWRAMYGLQKLAGILASDKYLRPGHVPRLPVKIECELLPLLAPGDVLVVRKEYALTNYFLPGYWPHAALFLGTAQQLKSLGIEQYEHVRSRWNRLLSLAESSPGVVLESMKDGVHFRSLASPFGVDSIVVLRPQLSESDIARGIARGLAHEGKPYDFDFDFRRSDRLVCTEVIYRALDGMGTCRLPLTKRAGRLNLSGGDLLRLALKREQFLPIAVYVPHIRNGLICDETVPTVIANAERCETSLPATSPSKQSQ